MNTPESARNGKIAHLPRSLRDQLNQRLFDGETAVSLVGWLNSLPEVQAVLARRFHNRPINPVNLHEWKSGGYRAWLSRREKLQADSEFVADTLEHSDIASPDLVEANFNLTALKFAKALANWNGEATEEFTEQLKLLGSLGRETSRMYRCAQQDRRVQLSEEKHDDTREKTREQVLEHYVEWTNNSDIRKVLILAPLERMRRMRQFSGIPPTREDLLVAKEIANDPAFAPKDKKPTENKPPPPQKVEPNSKAQITSDDESLPATTKNACPIASPSPGGEGRDEGELNSKPLNQNSTLTPPPERPKYTHELIAEAEAAATLSQREREGVRENRLDKNPGQAPTEGELNTKSASPVGTSENSPAFERRESNQQDISPAGTAELKNTPVISNPAIRPIGPLSPIPNSKLNPQPSKLPEPKPFVPSPYISDYEKAILEGKTPLEAHYLHFARPKKPSPPHPGQPPQPATDPYNSFCQPANAPDQRPPPEPTPSQYYCRCPAPGHHFSGRVLG